MAKQTKQKENAATSVLFVDTLTIRPVIALLKNKGLSVSSLMNTVRFKAAIEASSDEYYKVLEGVMEQHGVTAENGTYKLEEHAKAGEIKIAVDALQKSICHFSAETNFMSWKELHTAGEDLPVDILATLAKWLVKDE